MAIPQGEDLAAAEEYQRLYIECYEIGKKDKNSTEYVEAKKSLDKSYEGLSPEVKEFIGSGALPNTVG
jgi:hypothetical protein